MANYQLTQTAAQIQKDLDLTEHIQPKFSSSSTYAVGDLVTYNGYLYKCIVAITTAGDWTGNTNWAITTLKEELAGAGTSYTAGIGIDITSNVIKSVGVEYLTTAPTSDNVSGALKFVVLDAEPATKYEGYLYIIKASSSTPTVGYSGNITASDQTSGGNPGETYIKFDNAPTSSSDYDFHCNYLGIYNSNNEVVSSPTYTNKTKVYVWSNNGGTGGVIINGVTTETTGNVDSETYQDAVEVTLTGNYDIEMIYRTGGGFND